MGASIAIAAADADPVTRLILIAPFWRLGTVWQTAAGRILRPVLPPSFRPFEKADFGDHKVRHAPSRFFPSIDFDDSDKVDRLRSLSVPG